MHELSKDPEIILRLPNGDFFERTEVSLILHFAGRRKVLSNSPLNGGYREDLTHVFNHDCLTGTDGTVRMNGATYREHMLHTVEEIGLDPLSSAGLETAAQMKNASVKSLSSGGVCVSAVTTAGVDHNAARAGDTASWEERSDVPVPHPPGTINTILCISTDLSEGAMSGALMTATEAKAAAMQEFAVPSRYSSGLATGTGTDGIIIVADAQSPKYLTEAGKHAMLGEMIGKCVLYSIKEAIDMHSGGTAAYMHDAAMRMERFGVKPSKIPSDLRRRQEYVVAAGMLAHLLDELEWGLITEEDAITGAGWVFRNINGEVYIGDGPTAGPADARTIILNSWRELFNNTRD